MPNHCHNDLYIDGPKESVDALLALIGGSQEDPKFDFNSVLPYPAQFAERDKEMKELGYKAFAERYGDKAKDGYNSGGYEWCSENWGTKWNAYQIARRDYLGVCLTFQTAWSPPNPVIIALHKRFPLCTLRMESFEMGAAFVGGFSLISKEDWYEDEPWESGKVINEWSGKYQGHRGG
jgi:hypothetical protein